MPDRFIQAFPTPQIEWSVVIPIILVIGTGILALILELLRPKQTNNAIVGVSLLGLLAAGGYTLLQLGTPSAVTLSGMALRDTFGLSMQLLLIGICFVTILLSEGYLREKRIPFGEFYPLVLWSTSGAMIMTSTTNLLMMFIGLEVLSIALYVLAGLSRQESRSEESALKYFLLGAFASGFLLFGIAFFYGATGSLDIGALAAAFVQEQVALGALLLFGLGLMLIGLGFKAAFVPFHQWTPDVYQGAPTNVTAFMAAGSKVAAISALVRVLDAVQPLKEYWIPALFWIAILTMTVGNLVALVQRDVKRILAYSSIAHAGYILVAILAHSKGPGQITLATVTYYLVAYGLMTLGAFAVISLTAKQGGEGTLLSSLHGLWKRSPLAATAMVLFMASLIGVPPTAGFIGKFLIFSDALSVGLTSLAVILAINSAISVYYYLGIALACFVSEDEGQEFAEPSRGLSIATALCALGILGSGIFFKPLMTLIGPEFESVVPPAAAALPEGGVEPEPDRDPP